MISVKEVDRYGVFAPVEAFGRIKELIRKKMGTVNKP